MLVYKRICRAWRRINLNLYNSFKMEPEKKEEIANVEEEKKEVEKAEEKPEEMTEQEDLSIEEKAKKEGCLIDPYNVVNTTGKEIDYTKVVKNFGLQMVTQQQIDR